MMPDLTYCRVRMACMLPVISLILAGNTAFAATTEQTLAAAFLYNFLKFAEWPENTVTGDFLTLCVTSNSLMNDELDAIDGRSAQNKIVRTKRIAPGDNPLECHLLYLDREEKPILRREWLKQTQNQPTLTVGNQLDFLEIGGMIILLTEGNRLQFEVNLEAVNRSGLKLSAQLLKIARHVRGR